MPARVPSLTLRELNRALPARQFLLKRQKIRAVDPAVLELKPFKPLARTDRAALVEEGEKLVRFYAPDSETHGVRG